MLDNSGKIVSGLKRVNDLMNKNFVNIADKLLNERNDVFHNNHEFCFSSLCNDLSILYSNILNNSAIEINIRNMRLNKSVQSDVPNIRFVKLM